MATILQLPQEVLFFHALLVRLPENAREAVAIRLAAALRASGMAAAEWLSEPRLPSLLNEMSRYAGAAWLPDTYIGPATAEPTLTELNSALERRNKIAGRTAIAILKAADDGYGNERAMLLSLVPDAVRADEVTGAANADDKLLAGAYGGFLEVQNMPWAISRPRIASIEQQCRDVLPRISSTAIGWTLLGRILIWRASAASDRDAAQLWRDAIQQCDQTMEAAAWSGFAAARLAPRVSWDEGAGILEKAAGRLPGPNSPTSRALEIARMEMLLARTARQDTAAMKSEIEAAANMWEQTYPDWAKDPRLGLLRARLLFRIADLGAGRESERTLSSVRDIAGAITLSWPSEYGAHILLGDSLRRLAQLRPAEAAMLTKEAADSYRRAIALDPDRPGAYAGLIGAQEDQAQQDTGEQRVDLLEEAWKTAAAALDRFPEYGNMQRWAGRIRAAQSRLPGVATRQAMASEAARYFEQAATLAPYDAVIAENWGSLMVHQMRLGGRSAATTVFPATIEKLQMSLALRPGFKWALNHWAEAVAENAGYSSFEGERSDLTEAILKYGEALELDNTFDTALIGRARCAVRLSWVSNAVLAKNLLDEAVTDLDQVLQVMPENYLALRNMALARATMAGRAEGAVAIHHQEAALNCLQHAAQIRTDNPEIYNQIGDNLRWQGKYDRAVEAYEKVPKDDRQSYGWALAGIGWTRCDQSVGIPKEQVAVRLSESRDAFEQAIAVNPEEPSRRRGLGETLRRLAGIQAADRDRLWTEAEEQLRESLHLRAGDPNTLTALGDLYLDRSSVLQQTAEIWAMAGRASDQYALALQALPDHFGALYGSGRAAMALGRIAFERELFQKAITQFEAALQVRPDHPGAKHDLQQVGELLNSPPPKQAGPPV